MEMIERRKVMLDGICDKELKDYTSTEKWIRWSDYLNLLSSDRINYSNCIRYYRDYQEAQNLAKTTKPLTLCYDNSLVRRIYDQYDIKPVCAVIDRMCPWRVIYVYINPENYDDMPQEFK